jgi:phosphoribosylamine---glycine ligase
LRVLLINMDSVGELLPLGIRAAKAGHQVRLYLSPDNHPETGTGFKGIEKIDSWLPSVKWADLVVPSGNHEFMPKMDMLKKSGATIFGPSVASADLEIKRAGGMKFFTDHGIEVPEWKQFPTLAAAEAHVRKTGERYVFKTLGDEEDKSLSYVSKTPADMIARLQRWSDLKMNPKGPVMLQKVIDGIEFAVSRWMGSEGFVGEPNENFEFKKLLSGNCGPNCGESGTLLKYTAESKLFEDVLAPLEDDLIKMGHLGDIDVNCIIDEKGKAWPLEFTTRLGWPAANILWTSHKGDPIQWMKDACEGKDTLLTSPAVCCGIVLAQPDYPNSKFTKAEVANIPMYGVTKDNQKYLSPQCVKIDTMPDMQGEEVVERDIWCTTGDYLAVATGMGKTVKKACERAYATVKEIHVPNLMYRDDVGESLEESIPELQKHGFAVDWTYG